MPSEVTTVRGLLIAAALVPVLATAAGCGGAGSDSATAPKGSGRPAAASSAAPGRALTAAELKRALIGSADLRGPLYDPLNEALPSGIGVSDPDNTACTSLVEQLAFFPHRVPIRAQAVQVIDDLRAKDVMYASEEFLEGYAPGGAQQTMAALHTALKSCTTFTVNDGKGGRTPLRTTPVPPVDVGDDAVAYLVFNSGKTTPTALITVIRTGEQTVTYQSHATFHHDPVLPKDIAAAQDKKLRAAAA